MRIKYEEKIAEKEFIEEQKRVEDQLVQFNMSNKEQLREAKENYKKIQNTDNKLINANQEARKKERQEISKLNEDLSEVKAQIDNTEKDLQGRKAEKAKLEYELKQLSIYEHFLYKVMLVSEEQEKDEKPKEAIKKMIDRYERLKKKQRDLKLDLQEKEQKKVGRHDLERQDRRDEQHETRNAEQNLQDEQRDAQNAERHRRTAQATARHRHRDCRESQNEPRQDDRVGKD